MTLDSREIVDRKGDFSFRGHCLGGSLGYHVFMHL